jgi:ribonuclease-3
VVESGPDHAKAFHATAVVGGNGIGEGNGRSKKEAEQRAAEQAWTALTSDGAGETELSSETATS